MDGKLQTLIVLLLYNLVLWIFLFTSTTLTIGGYVDSSDYEFTSDLIEGYQEEYDTLEMNMSEFTQYAEDNKLKIFGSALFFNISNLGIWSVFIVFIPLFTMIGLGVLVLRGV